MSLFRARSCNHSSLCSCPTSTEDSFGGNREWSEEQKTLDFAFRPSVAPSPAAPPHKPALAAAEADRTFELLLFRGPAKAWDAVRERTIPAQGCPLSNSLFVDCFHFERDTRLI